MHNTNAMRQTQVGDFASKASFAEPYIPVAGGGGWLADGKDNFYHLNASTTCQPKQLEEIHAIQKDQASGPMQSTKQATH